MRNHLFYDDGQYSVLGKGIGDNGSGNDCEFSMQQTDTKADEYSEVGTITWQVKSFFVMFYYASQSKISVLSFKWIRSFSFH
ncbi:CLUMA_CG015517, isoform A [Clunio marinus]|uniref:CLUMA_CG015517, isoform A n=1 Tax=Clunio marinus TaxID=568069 RepID=A0A1J1IS41_9DIPT|nr:CLUMA_CG015517, isoform A [Clunio marinus]